MIVYGISNCDAVRRARAWLHERGTGYTFYDFKNGGVPEQRLDDWLKAVGWEALINRKGTTWRKLDVVLKGGVTDSGSARELMLQQSSVIKRPVVEWDDGRITVGFDAGEWARRQRNERR
jgi:arsenate reductase